MAMNKKPIWAVTVPMHVEKNITLYFYGFTVFPMNTYGLERSFRSPLFKGWIAETELSK